MTSSPAICWPRCERCSRNATWTHIDTTSSEIVPSCVVDVVVSNNPNRASNTKHHQQLDRNNNVKLSTNRYLISILHASIKNHHWYRAKAQCNTRCSSLTIHLHSPYNAVKVINLIPHKVKESASENAGEAVIKATAVILRHSTRAQTTRWNAVEAVTRVHPYLLHRHGRVMGSAVLVALVIPSTVMCPNEDVAKSLSRTQIRWICERKISSIQK